MGYYQRRIGEALVPMVGLLFAVALVAVGPWMIGKAISGPTLGWIFEAVYICLVVMAVRALYRKMLRDAGHGPREVAASSARATAAQDRLARIQAVSRRREAGEITPFDALAQIQAIQSESPPI